MTQVSNGSIGSVGPKLDFYFDVLCPYAWRTSLWIREVAQQRPLDITWKQFSLALVNNAEPGTPRYDRGMLFGRLFIAAERLGGNSAVDRLYLAIGDALHGGQGLDPTQDDVLQPILESVGLPAELREIVLDDDTTEQELRASHEQGLARGAFGVPSLVFDGEEDAYFGPVVDPLPNGEQAVELFDFTRWAARQPYLWEIKRDRKGRKLGPQPATVGIESVPNGSEVDACAWVPAAAP